MKKHKNTHLVLFEYFIFLFFRFLIRRLPLKLGFHFTDFLGFIVYMLDKRHRTRTIQHLLHAGVVNNTIEAKKLALKTFKFYGSVFLELIKFDQYLNKDNIYDHVTLDVSEEIKNVLHDPKGLIYVGAHFGNWEMSGLGSSLLIRPLVSVIRPFDNPLIGKYIISKRRNFNQEICSKKNAIKPLLSALKKGKAIAILCDQHAGGNEGVLTEFFGHPAQTHSAPAYLSIKTGAPLILGLARRLDNKLNYEFIARGPFKVEPSGDIEKDIIKLAQMYTTELEKVISKYPEQWVWSHRRWLDINRKGSEKYKTNTSLNEQI